MSNLAGFWVCRGSQNLRKGRTARTPSGSNAFDSRFFGDPGPGKVITGTIVGGDGVPWMDTNAGFKHVLVRHYWSPALSSGSIWTRSDITGDHANGCTSYGSFKLGTDTFARDNAADILAGVYDSTFIAEAQWAAGLGYQIFLSFFHEPEDNFTTAAQCTNYRAITRHIIQIFRDQGASNVVWAQTIWMCPFSFTSSAESSRGLEWFQWDPDWKGTRSGSNGRPNASDYYTGTAAMLDILGLDTYMPNIGGTAYHEFSSPVNTAFTRMVADGRTLKPFMIGEFGVSGGTTTTGIPTGMPSDSWTGFFQRAFQYMRDNQGVGFCTYTIGGTSYQSGDDHVNRLNGYKAAHTSETSYLLTTSVA